jgi:hypothetical protein
MKTSVTFALSHPPANWKRLGIALQRGGPDAYDASVTGDPCIVWDEDANRYRMFYFAQRHENGKEINSIVQALAQTDMIIPNRWRKLGPVVYRNPDVLLGDAHKPWIMMDPYRPNIPAKVEGKYWLFASIWHRHTKRIQLATADTLSGPWEVRPEPVIDLGSKSSFDGYHNDTVTAYWFAEREQILLFYKGYPAQPQPDQLHSPYGSSSAVAVMRVSDRKARKLGKILSPISHTDHWLAGWVGGIQVFPAAQGGWYGLLNGSPTPPDSVEREPEMREPAPSLGGWAYTAQEWPVSGWEPEATPIEWIEDIPAEAQANGEGVNIWRHHGFVTPDGKLYLLYNSGCYGQEQLFLRVARQDGAIQSVENEKAAG